LSAEENLWLKSLSNEHDIFTIDKLGKEIDKKGKDARLEAYLYAILTANFIVAKEALKMKDTFERFYEETGLAAKAEARGEARGIARGIARGKAEGEARGRAEGRAETAHNLKSLGVSTDLIIKSTGLSPEEIARL
jgi:predicted transposase/invertase (TIGR01784 family)